MADKVASDTINRPSKSFLLRRPKTVLAIIAILGIFLVCAFAEIFLREYLPLNYATIGHVNSKNARLYGWGFAPNEEKVLVDPDTGETSRYKLNNHGWRDKDRDYENTKKAYRIVVIGDSGTFGIIVPPEKIYTRVLEDKLIADGYNVEVINISYGGWGTDQELEALKEEGLKYSPDLVILQFCANDVHNNTACGANEGNPAAKPFCYRLDPAGKLTRRDNTIDGSAPKSFREKTKRIASKFELFKRIYALYVDRKLRDSANLPPKAPDKPKSEVLVRASTEKQIQILKTVFGFSSDDPLVEYLEENMGRELEVDKLVEIVDGSGHADRSEAILKILEKRWFHEYWSVKQYFPEAPDMQSEKWRLFFALLGEFRRVCERSGAKQAIVSDNEIGAYEWALSWHRVAPGDVFRKNFLTPGEFIRKYAFENGIDFVENVVPVERARNDPHPNIKGNEAMAENIYRFLMERHRPDLERHR